MDKKIYYKLNTIVFISNFLLWYDDIICVKSLYRSLGLPTVALSYGLKGEIRWNIFQKFFVVYWYTIKVWAIHDQWSEGPEFESY